MIFNIFTQNDDEVNVPLSTTQIVSEGQKSTVQISSTIGNGSQKTVVNETPSLKTNLLKRKQLAIYSLKDFSRWPKKDR